jgi:predicted dehydrogenase
MPERHEYEIVGEKGWLNLDVNGGTLRIGRDSNVAVETHELDRDAVFRAEHQAFLEAVEGRRGPETSGDDGLVSMAVCEGAIRSWQEGRQISLTFGSQTR